ncbi:MAG: hypothetical protein AMXMBFR84_17370 [Candidatus Hydrogenedentota bacterium]
MLLAGEGIVDITPPLGIELAGFHKPLGRERRVAGARKPAFVRALVLKVNESALAILQLDMLAVSPEFSRRVQQRAEAESGIPAAHVRVCATHTHGMPTFRALRQWGAISPDYMASVEAKCIEALKQAVADLSEADCYIGADRVKGGNFNRTSKVWKTDEAFDANATDSDRWLDTMLHALFFQRADNKTPILWYHFCAHPVCYQDELAGPDWPALVAEGIQASGAPNPGFLQGHIGDVNPGDGSKWIGEARPTATAILPALHHAATHGEMVRIDEIRVQTREIEIPFDVQRLRDEIAFYKAHPEECTKGIWVDEGFAKAWYAEVSTWTSPPESYKAAVSTVQLGELGMLFHPSELYSYYGLKIRHASPFPNTLVVGYCEDFIGYLTDPRAYDDNEYAAVVVPKLCSMPPFEEEASRIFTDICIEQLKSMAS